MLECRHEHARLSGVNVHRMHSRPLREDAFRGSVRQLARLGDGLAGDLVVLDIEPVAQVRVPQGGIDGIQSAAAVCAAEVAERYSRAKSGSGEEPARSTVLSNSKQLR